MGKMLFLACLKSYYCGCGSFSYLIQRWLVNVCFLLLAHCVLRNRLQFPSCVCLASYKLQPSVPLEVDDSLLQRLPYFLFYKESQTRWFIVILLLFILSLLLINMKTQRSLNKQQGGPHMLELLSRDISSKFIVFEFRATIKVKQ